MRNARVLAAALTSAALLLPVFASATIREVNGPGTDPSRPQYPTIGAAIMAAAHGDTVLVYNIGTSYHEAVVVPASLPGLILQGVNTPIIDGVGLLASGIVVQAQGVTVQGFAVTNFRDPHPGSLDPFGAGILIDAQGGTPTTASVVDNVLYDNDTGVRVLGPGNPDVAQDYEVKGNTAYGVTQLGVEIRLVDGAEIRRNTLHDCLQGVLVDTSGSCTVTANTIRNAVRFDLGGICVTNCPGGYYKKEQPNVVAGNQVSDCVGPGISIGGCAGQVVSGNTLTGNDVGIEAWFGSANITVSGNQVVGSLSVGILLDGFATKCSVTDNDVSGSVQVGVLADASASDNHVQHNAVVGSGVVDLEDDGLRNNWANNTYGTSIPVNL